MIIRKRNGRLGNFRSKAFLSHGKESVSINRKSKNSFLLKDILVLVGGTSIAQLVAIALTPLLSRVYSPAPSAPSGPLWRLWEYFL